MLVDRNGVQLEGVQLGTALYTLTEAAKPLISLNRSGKIPWNDGTTAAKSQ